ncbi:hypothetical protein GDO81_028973 [Engystomops pustulosus]|uniref:Uncharacterized protein n=1 Tax=Engystomops pustulosus TaxID=76066 RepID=A0AAV6YMQ8_ENGPU|nr:hypothetical protein GDO81_028973 [Engystomops pustulosus]
MLPALLIRDRDPSKAHDPYLRTLRFTEKEPPCGPTTIGKETEANDCPLFMIFGKVHEGISVYVLSSPLIRDIGPI